MQVVNPINKTLLISNKTIIKETGYDLLDNNLLGLYKLLNSIVALFFAFEIYANYHNLTFYTELGVLQSSPIGHMLSLIY